MACRLDQVYLKAHSTLRDDMREWRSAFQALYEATPLAARMLLSQAASEPCLPSLSDVLGQGSPVHELPQLAPHFLENYITRNDQVPCPYLLTAAPCLSSHHGQQQWCSVQIPPCCSWSSQHPFKCQLCIDAVDLQC